MYSILLFTTTLVPHETPLPPPKEETISAGCNLQTIETLVGDLELARAVFAVIQVESGCNPRARGSSGEIGAAQIRPEIWASSLVEAGVISDPKDLWTMDGSIASAAWILVTLPGSMPEKIRRYNGSGDKARQYRNKVLHIMEYTP
jgi:hypothetical protein